MTVAPLEELIGPLTAWLSERLRHPDVVVDDVARPPAGQSNDTVLCAVSWHDGGERRRRRLVIRRQATAHPIFRHPDVIREFRVLEGLAGTRVPAPRVLWSEPDPGVLGAPFFAMEHVAGRVPAGKPSIHAVGWLPTLTTAQRERVWGSALDALVAVHEVDWRARHGFLLDGDPRAATMAGHVERLVDWYRWSVAGRAFPITDAAVDYVQRHCDDAGAGEPVLVWGDARIGNMIVGDDGLVAATIDWETASVGPAAIDVAHWLFFDEFATDAAGIERPRGWPDRSRTIALYEAASGRNLGDLSLYDIVDRLFMATTLIRQADARVAQGLAPAGTRMGHDNTVTQMLAKLLGLPVPLLSDDYLAHRGIPRPPH